MTSKKTGRVVNLEKLETLDVRDIIDNLSSETALPILVLKKMTVSLGIPRMGPSTSAETILKLGLLLIDDKQREEERWQRSGR